MKMSVTIPYEKGKTYDFRSCTCGSDRKPGLDRDFRIGFKVYCPACGLTTLPEIHESQAVSAWDCKLIHACR